MARPPRPVVTDHALLRYLERVIGINVAAHRAAIKDRVAEAVERGGCALVSGGFRYKLTDSRVTTVLPVKKDPRFPEQREADGE